MKTGSLRTGTTEVLISRVLTSLHNDDSSIWNKMTLRAKKTKEVCKKFKVLEEKFHSEKSVFFNLPRASLNDLEKRTTHYQEYYNKTQEGLEIMNFYLPQSQDVLVQFDLG